MMLHPLEQDCALSHLNRPAARLGRVNVRSIPKRLLCAALAAVVLATPASALAHGLAHHHLAAEHESGEHHGAPEHVPAVEESDHGHEHAHPRVDRATRERTDDTAAMMLPMPAAVSIVDCATGLSTDVLVPRPAFPPGDPHTGPPPRLRAPPLA